MKKIIKTILNYFAEYLARFSIGIAVTIIGIVVFVTAFFIVASLVDKSGEDNSDSLEQAVVTDTVGKSSISTEDMSVEEMAAMAQGIYWGVHLEAIKETGDDEFVSFVLEKINPVCPFYEPDGISYRDCLNNLVDGIREKFNGSASELEEVENYCDSISEKYYPSLEAAELYQCCIAYKLSKDTDFLKDLVVYYGVLFRFSTSGELRFAYYDIEKDQLVDDPCYWFFAYIPDSEKAYDMESYQEITKPYIDFLLEENKGAVFKITGARLEDDDDYFSENENCKKADPLHVIDIDKIEVYKKSY